MPSEPRPPPTLTKPALGQHFEKVTYTSLAEFCAHSYSLQGDSLH